MMFSHSWQARKKQNRRNFVAKKFGSSGRKYFPQDKVSFAFLERGENKSDNFFARKSTLRKCIKSDFPLDSLSRH